MFRTALVAACAAALLPAAAMATPLSRSVEVSHADLDLATSDGRTTLDARITLAAKRVCGFADPRDLKALADVQRCRADAVAEARGRAAVAVVRAGGGLTAQVAD
jgi:UrcA family protein